MCHRKGYEIMSSRLGVNALTKMLSANIITGFLFRSAFIVQLASIVILKRKKRVSTAVHCPLSILGKRDKF
jgi:hypothetical protein